MKGYCYILTNKNKNVRYIGTTNNLRRRIGEHKNGKYEYSFTKRYNCPNLVYFEEFDTVKEAFKEKSN